MKKLPLSVFILFSFISLTAHAVDRYVDLNNSTPVSPYTNWVTAAKEIQLAVDVAEDGDVIWVTNGHYNITSQITVSNEVTIQSVNGPDVTVVDAQFYERGFYLNNDSCILSGLSIINGDVDDSGGGVKSSFDQATITNCYLIGNHAEEGGGAQNGTFIDCTFSANTASDSGGGLSDGIAIRCRIQYNLSSGSGGGAASSALKQCEIMSNSSFGNGGGVQGGLAENCLIVNNLANYGLEPHAYVYPYDYVPPTAEGGGGAHSATLRNCTVCDNFSFGTGGGVHSGAVYNSIVAYNGAQRWSNDHQGEANIFSAATYGSVEDNYNGFMDRNNGDYRLVSGSRCIDTGIGIYVLASEDLDGNLRVQNGQVDIGAYEYGVAEVPATPGYTEICYVSVATGNDTNSGTTWAEAKATIQAGVNAVVDGGTVWVSNGVYNLTQEITIGKPLSLQSVSGADETIIDAQWFGRCILVNNLTAGLVTIEGFTLQNGFLWDDGWLTGYENEAAGSGGALYNATKQRERVLLVNCVVSENTACYSGGGVAYANLTDCVVRNNEATGNNALGGGAYLGNATNTLFIGNSSENAGGGLVGSYNSGNFDAYAVYCTFKNNSAGNDAGGGLGGGALNIIAIYSTFVENSAEHGGGMAVGKALGCLFANNTAGYGGGVAHVDLTSSTVVGNVGGGVETSYGEDFIKNTIVYSNASYDIDRYVPEQVMYSCSPTLTEGLGNITNAPVFVDADAGNYRLAESSPCIDAGMNAFASQEHPDLDGNPRFYNVRVDMGAYEFSGVLLDNDGDGLSNQQEQRLGSDPNDPDSDGDGFDDGWEVAQGWNPNDCNTDVVSYLDENASSFGFLAESAVGDLSMGAMMVGVSNSTVNLSFDVLQSEDLINWTNLGQSVQWSVPATNKAFFRIHAQP